MLGGPVEDEVDDLGKDGDGEEQDAAYHLCSSTASARRQHTLRTPSAQHAIICGRRGMPARQHVPAP